MKKIILASCVLLAFALKSQNLYDLNSINNIEITFTQTNWDQILDTYYANGLDERLMATVVINGENFDSVGVKFKGNSTYNANNAKNPFNIKLDEFINQDYDGYSLLKLSTGDKDPTFVREVLGYEIARKYMDAPQSNYAKVTVNGSYIGLYDNVESVNSDYQERYLYANRDATRLKCNPVNVTNGGSSLEYLGPNEASYYDYYELASDTGWTDIITLTNIVDNAPILIEDYLDIDRAIWMLAYNNVLVNLDSYTGPFKQNYYLIRAKNDNMTPIIWDLNQSMGSFSMVNQGPPGGTLAQMDILLRENDSSWPLLKLIFDDPTYKRMYIAHCKTIYEENIANDLYYDRALNLQSLFGSDLQADVNAIYTFAQAQSNLTATVSGGGGPGGGFIGLKELFDDRKTYLEGTSQFQASTPTISNIDKPESVPANSQLTVSAEVSNSSNVIFGYRLFQGDRFTKISMLDDGLNGDVSAGDDIFTATIPVEATDIQFYVYAENNNAGIFSPIRAEHEFHTVSTSSDIVLNEIQARNKLTQPDQDGEFDDWIELYNNSTSSVDISNYYLSDKGSDLARWQFPAGTIIPPDDYLIVWADADTFQGGLHANFKLSGGGESVYLTDGTTVLDKIKYVYFWADTTYGRFPNGTGPLTLMTATFKAFNGLVDTGTAIIDRIPETQFSIYPNPSQGVFFISAENNEPLEIIVYDLLGHMMYEGKERQVFTRQWSAGVYIVNVNGTSKKIIVE
ncbi:MAG: hypothetical protein ACI825_001804 [Planctomycetota bacterium]|jgi:hypothetical protein